MTVTDDTLPRWDVSDLHESLDARTFTSAVESFEATIERLRAMFDERDIRGTEPRPVDGHDAESADEVIAAYNEASLAGELLSAYVYATVSTNSRDATAQAAMSELTAVSARLSPLLSRLAEWVASLGAESLGEVSDAAAEHGGPLLRLAVRARHQMTESDEHLYAELATTGSASWKRLHADLTSQLSGDVELPDGAQRMPMPAIRGLATDPDPAVRRAAYDAELATWPQVAVACAAALNSIKGEANIVNRRRGWPSPLDASLFANSVGRSTFDAMQSAVAAALPDLRTWMRTKARLHGHDDALPWWDLFAPAPVGDATVSWSDGVRQIRGAFNAYSQPLGALVDRALDERWIDADVRDGKVGGAFCMPFLDDRSLVLLNWSGSADAAQTTAHELGHAYHNTTLAGRTPLQRRLPMALAETASIFCETLVVEDGLTRLEGDQRLALLDVDLQGALQVVVDIHSRFLFETEVFARRQRRALAPQDFDELMIAAQQDAYGGGLDQSTAHPQMWIVKPHYYGSHFYNWPYTYGLLFGLGLYARFRDDPDGFRATYDDLLSRAGMDTAEELGQAFGFDVGDEAFWTASLDVIRTRIADYERLTTS
jgi:pepF/M3 family oligoendopeptidase